RLLEPSETRDRMTGRPVSGGASNSISIGPEAKTLAFVHHTADKTGEIYLWEEGKPKPRALTSHNAALVSQLDLPAAEGFTFSGADHMQGLVLALEKYPFLDKTTLAAAGGSYGGFMVNCICGHTDRFKALISHAGVFDLVSMYG